MKQRIDWKGVVRDLEKRADKKRALVSISFFKTGKGQYGEGDQFIGVTMPDQRLIAKKYIALRDADVIRLLQSSIHEQRMVGLVIWTLQMPKADDRRRRELAMLYLKHRARINNWDLVDVTASTILGDYLFHRSRSVLYRLARAKSIWDRRIAIVTTLAFIRRGDLRDTFNLAEILMNDPHDLLHKATGWMLREAGKKDEKALHLFLDKYAIQMPRTMLRYAIERLSPGMRKKYLLLKQE